VTTIHLCDNGRGNIKKCIKLHDVIKDVISSKRKEKTFWFNCVSLENYMIKIKLRAYLSKSDLYGHNLFYNIVFFAKLML
jgi:hypothetical protein